MKYFVMECHPGYAVVLDQEGRFMKVANLCYEVGQTVTQVIESTTPDQTVPGWQKQLPKILSTAACLCLVFLGANHYLISPQSTVQMSINPEVQMTVNRLDHVLTLEGTNEDGIHLTEAVSYFGKKVDTLAVELADKAIQEGYLSDDGQITLTINGKNEEGNHATEDRLRECLSEHFEGRVVIIVQPPTQNPAADEPNTEQSTAPSESSPSTTQTPSNTVTIPIRPTTEENTTDNKDTDYGPGNDGVTDYEDTDYGPDSDDVADHEDADDGPGSDGITDYGDTDYGPGSDGVTDYEETDYAPGSDGVTDHEDADPESEGDSSYGSADDYLDNDGDTNYGSSDYGDTTNGPNNDDDRDDSDNGTSDYDDSNYGE